jgi:protein-L-isoaspartate(D-aspartate) O-methyltransferase
VTDAETLNRKLVDDLRAADVLPDHWRPAFLSTPRHWFAPDVIWTGPDHDLTEHKRQVDDADWLEMVYRDEPIVTQVDDGTAAAAGRPVTSSISKPSIVAAMLDHLDVEPGMRVLEIGTGSGWNAALLARRVGEPNVTTIEIDPQIASGARQRLAHAGISSTVVTGDGAAGYVLNAPYDRVIATASVQRIPPAWIHQTRPGGVILTPWGTAFDNGALVHLVVEPDGTATGRFVDNTVAFMWIRDQRVARVTPPTEVIGATESATTLHPDGVAWDDYDAKFAVGVWLPDVRVRFIDADNGSDDFTFWAQSGPSWARVDVTDGVNEYRVRQYGSRRLWDEVETAYNWWLDAGKPSTDRFGLTVDLLGRQTIWLDSPDNLVGRPTP